MTIQEFERLLQSTFADRHLSRGERRELLGRLEADLRDEQRLSRYRALAFRIARGCASAGECDVIDWLEDVNRLLLPRSSDGEDVIAEAHFAPGPHCVGKIIRLIRQAKERLDLCVYTVTDDRIKYAIMDARKRLEIRIVSDCTKSCDPGSDVEVLCRAGIEVKLNPVGGLMHHKFAVFDRQCILTGSYNWTRTAADENYENIIVSTDLRLVRRFLDEFDRLWNCCLYLEMI